MKIAIIYGTTRKEQSSTYNIAQLFIRKLKDKDAVTEFFLPKDMPHFCTGCWQCFSDYTKCPHYSYLEPIVKAIDEADLLIFTSPVYVYHVTGQMKAFLDHFGYRWMIHQPREEMFSKQALLITTCAGAGSKSTLKDLKDSMNYWGIARIHTVGENVMASSWQRVTKQKKDYIRKKVLRISNKILANSQNIKPSLKVKRLFYTMRFVQKKYRVSEADAQYWREKGWFGKVRPWDNSVV